MTTLDRYIEQLIQFRNEYPESADLPVFYSSDDEGNSFHAVNFEPGFMVFEEVLPSFPEVSTDADKEPNAVVIN